MEDLSALPRKPLGYASVSLIENFDADTEFGCNRKLYFEQVLGFKPPDNPSAALGTLMHASLADYITTGVNGLHPLTLSGKTTVDMYRNRHAGRAVELKFPNGKVKTPPLLIEGLPLYGAIDLLVLAGLEEPLDEWVDWKSSSNIEKYAMDADKLRDSWMAAGYSKWVFTRRADGHFPGKGPLRASLVYFQTKGAKRSERVTTVLDEEFVEKRWTAMGSMVKSMVDVSKETSVEKIPADTRKCNIAFGCPHRERCPRSLSNYFPTTGVNMALDDIFTGLGIAPQPVAAAPIAPAAPVPLVDLFGNGAPPPPAPAAPAAPAPQPAPAAPVVNTEAPTAPSVPVVAQAPAPAPQPVPMVKFEAVPPPRSEDDPARKRGRPPGSKNKVHRMPIVDVDASGHPMEPAASVAPAPTPQTEPRPVAPGPTTFVPTPPRLQEQRITRMTVRHGLTLNMGNFQSAKVEVELEAEGGTVAELDLAVRTALEKAAQPYLAGNAAAQASAKK